MWHQRVNQGFRVCYNQWDVRGNGLYDSRKKKKNRLSASPLRAMCDYSSGLAAIVYVSWDFVDKLLSFITLRFDLGWLFALVPVPQEDKSVWEWLECINTTELHWAHSHCLYSAAGTCLSEMIKTHRQTEKKSCHCRRVFHGGLTSLSALGTYDWSPGGSLCLLL